MIRIKKSEIPMSLFLWGLGIGPIFTGLFDDRTPTTLGATGQLSFAPENLSRIQFMNRGISLFLLLTAIVLIFSKLIRDSSNPWLLIDKDVAFMLAGILLYTLAIFISSIFGAFPDFNYRVFYQLIIILALILFFPKDYQQALLTTRKILVIIIMGSFLLFLIKPEQASIVTRSWIPIINFRLYGLTYHPNTLGTLCCLFLLIILVFPYKSKILTILLGSISGIALLLTQSKTSWVILFVGIFLIINEPNKKMSLDTIKLRKATNVIIILLIIVGAVLVTFSNSIILFLTEILGENFTSTLVSRTSVWVESLRVFKQNPIFGYGPTLWNIDFRTSVGLPTVGHAHNQFVQTIAESGILGFIGLSIHLFSLVKSVLKTKNRFRGFSLALLSTILLKSITETPFNNYHIDTPFFIHVVIIYLLMLVLVNNEQINISVLQPSTTIG